jgi:hypothetical protein
MRVEALVMTAGSSGLAVWSEIANAPPEIQWIMAATAGTIAGATASVFAYPNLSHGQRLARIAVSFCAGLLLAPYAAAHIPRPDTIPHAMHVFSVAGLCSFVAWSFVRAAQRRLGGIAERALDKVAPRKQRQRDEHEDGGP